MKSVFSLDGKWKIEADPNDIGKELGFFSPEIDSSSWQEVNIPCHWELEVPHYYKANPEIIWARKEFLLKDIGGRTKLESKLIYLYFKGIFYYADIYLNGYSLGHHEGYFKPFGFLINSYLKSENVLIIRVACMNEKDLGSKKQILGTFGH